jgi:23S rRNA pseudouridine1911/1915/1917 synthase
MRVLDLSVPAPGRGERLDRFLAAAQTDLSRSRLQGLIRAGRVSVNGRAARSSHRLRDGDRVQVQVPEPEPTTLVAEAIPLAIVHEDPDLVVLEKPAGMIVHPGAGARRGTLVHALLHHYPEIAAVGGSSRPGIVHRLDKDTSGLLVVARSSRAYRVLVEALRAREVRRTYAALVWGDPRQAGGVIETALGRHPKDRKRMAVLPRGGKAARTRWRVVERLGLASLLEVQLDTGRTHQIRVHMAHLGHPVVGDPVYGGRGKKLLSLGGAERSLASEVLMSAPRQALHASALEFVHPVTGSRLVFGSSLPEDFGRALDLLRAFRAPGPR